MRCADGYTQEKRKGLDEEQYTEDDTYRSSG